MAFVQTSGTTFTLDGIPLYLRGANNYYLIYKSPFMVCDVLDRAVAMNMDVIRTWAFLDRGSLDHTVPDTDPPGDKEGVYFQYWDGAPAYNDGPTGLERLDFVLDAARERNLKLILPLVNNWEKFGGMDQYLAWYGLRDHCDFYADANVRDAYKNWALHLIERYKDDPAILAWELANEPRCDDDPDALTDWVAEMSDFLKQHDPNHLVSAGDENGDFLDLPSIDFGTIHLYPKKIASGKDTIENALPAAKPIILEEYGWRDLPTRALAYTTWLDTFRASGGAGDLVWMLAGRQDDGTLYPDYDGFTIYGS